MMLSGNTEVKWSQVYIYILQHGHLDCFRLALLTPATFASEVWSPPTSSPPPVQQPTPSAPSARGAAFSASMPTAAQSVAMCLGTGLWQALSLSATQDLKERGPTSVATCAPPTGPSTPSLWCTPWTESTGKVLMWLTWWRRMLWLDRHEVLSTCQNQSFLNKKFKLPALCNDENCLSMDIAFCALFNGFLFWFFFSCLDTLFQSCLLSALSVIQRIQDQQVLNNLFSYQGKVCLLHFMPHMTDSVDVSWLLNIAATCKELLKDWTA